MHFRFSFRGRRGTGRGASRCTRVALLLAWLGRGCRAGVPRSRGEDDGGGPNTGGTSGGSGNGGASGNTGAAVPRAASRRVVRPELPEATPVEIRAFLSGGAGRGEAGAGGAWNGTDCEALDGQEFEGHCYVDVDCRTHVIQSEAGSGVQRAGRVSTSARVTCWFSTRARSKSSSSKQFLVEYTDESDAWLALTCPELDQPDINACYCAGCSRRRIAREATNLEVARRLHGDLRLDQRQPEPRLSLRRPRL